MDVANELLEIGIFLTNNGFVSILKQIPVSSVTMIEADDVSGQQPSHHRRQRHRAGPEEQVGMVREKSPGIASGSRFLH